MFSCQDDPDPNEEANHETDDETKARRVTHRAFTEIENSRRFIFVHGEKSAPLPGERKTAEALFPAAIALQCDKDLSRVDDISKWSD
jgi:hypothetical protein